MIKELDMTPQEIVEFLEKGAIYSSFADILESVYQGDDLKKTLQEQMVRITGARPDSVARNIRNWLHASHSNMPRREQLFQICFALKLDAAQADKVIASASEMGIHYRNPTELVYAYCLDNHKSWQEAQALLVQTSEILRQAEEEDPGNIGIKETDIYKCRLKKEFQEGIGSDEELKNFFRKYVHVFGEFHETAYREFLHLLACLQDPEGGYCDEEYVRMKKYPEEYSRAQIEEIENRWRGAGKISIEEVSAQMMRMHVPINTTRKKGVHGQNTEKNYTYLQKVIKKNWPSEDILLKMRSREIDVSRKVMLLLFLLTEEFEVMDTGENSDKDYLDELAMQETAGGRMEKRMFRINLFLDRYGMNRLDPGNPFDCIVLYALRAGPDDEGRQDDMHSRLESVLKELFGEKTADETEKGEMENV